MTIIDDMKWRYATKEFDSARKLKPEQLNQVLESLRLSSSSFGLQPWKFLVIENQEVKNSLVEHSWNQKQVSDASQVIVMCIPTSFGNDHVESFINDISKTRGIETSELDGYKNMMLGFLSKMSDQDKISWMTKQVYISLGHMLTACANLRIDACPMEGFISKEYDRILSLKEKNLTSVLVCPVGFRSENDKHAQLKKVRFSKEEVFIHI